MYTQEQLEKFKRLKAKGISNTSMATFRQLPKNIIEEISRDLKPGKFIAFNHPSRMIK